MTVPDPAPDRDEWGRRLGWCNSCGEEAPLDTDCCEDGEVVPYDDDMEDDDD